MLFKRGLARRDVSFVAELAWKPQLGKSAVPAWVLNVIKHNMQPH